MSTTVDLWGVPHVRARDVLGLAHEQGRVTVELRGDQLERQRRYAEGRIAALDGPSGVEWDTFARRLGIAEVARRGFERLDPETAAFVTAYVDGVRAAGLDGWQPWTPLAVFLVEHVHFANYPHALWRHHVRRHLGEEAVGLLRREGRPHGSNAFVVGGGRTASGLPLVGGDPHRILESPNVYQQVRLTCDELDVVGLTFPGVPGVQHFGHAGDVAWAVTNAMADHQELTPVTEADVLSRRTEVVEVAGAEPVTVEVATTRYGPVVVTGADGDAWALRTPSTTDGDVGFGALLPLLRARSVADVDAALDAWVEPVNNWVVADTAGRLLHRVAGQVPGADALPRVEGGPDDVLVTANDRRDDSFAVLGNDFAPPFRRDRIGELLGQDPDGGWDTATAAAVLTDDLQVAGRSLLQALPSGSWVTDRLRTWDGRMAADSEEAALFAAVRARLVGLVCEAPALEPLRGPCPYGALHGPWFDLPGRVATALPHLLEQSDDVRRVLGVDLAALLAQAVADVAADPPTGVWGERHRLVHDGTPLGGDSDCVAATGCLPGSDLVVRGPVARYVWDLADRGRSRWAVPEGSQVEAWATGALVPVEQFALRPVDPPRDAALIHSWVDQPRAEFWGMRGKPLAEVEAIYAWIVEQEHLTAQLVLDDGAPVGLVQSYDPFVDEIGEHYDRRPGDVGLHLFLADVPARAGHTTALMAYLTARVFADPRVERLVMEPDVRNEKSVGLLRRLGATFGPVTELPGKTAQLAFLVRQPRAASSFRPTRTSAAATVTSAATTATTVVVRDSGASEDRP
ncbi:GNAT family N-acetyltransferase [Nocardioides campestrisoli]|uniref:GNAT family N-acetyltransferase n=1 Tax=Nocardioides campestrisoli TaxID=2736757 RepID=UPI0015E6C3B0|nr:GNAT family N-acetyltransferase [Nocardioides campestrisoli]